MRAVRPAQCTLVPDSDAQLTSDHGFDLARDGERLRPLIEELCALGIRVSLFMDPDPAQSPAQAWQRIDRQSPNFGFTHDSYWFRFQIDNRDAQTLARFIELPIPYLEDVQLYHYVGGVLQIHYTLGAQSPFAQRVVRYPNFIMPVQLVPGINQIYLRLASAGTIEAPLRIWDPVRFYAASNDENLAQGSVIGVLLVMVIYNLFVFFSTRDINYIYYIGFVASYLMFHLSLTGYAFAYVWPQAVRWNSFAISTFVASSAFFTCLFTENFLRLRCSSLAVTELKKVSASSGWWWLVSSPM